METFVLITKNGEHFTITEKEADGFFSAIFQQDYGASVYKKDKKIAWISWDHIAALYNDDHLLL